MEERNKNGHRQRMRDTYKSVGIDGMDDAKVLELYLSLAIPRRDVRELSYRLINTFGSLKNVFDAGVAQLMKVDGVGENTAVLISLSRDIQHRIIEDMGKDIQYIRTSKDAMDFATSKLYGYSQERILVVALDNDCGIIKTKIFESDGVNFADARPKDILQFLLLHNSAGVVVAHNHPNTDSDPSSSDINFNLNFMELMRTMNIQFADHIIVGINGATSMRDNNYNIDLFKNIDEKGINYEGIND